MIGYTEIYEALRKERYSEQLQQLPKNFFHQFGKYVREKRKQLNKKDEQFSDTLAKVKKQLENAMMIMKDLRLRREKKILYLAMLASQTGIAKKDAENMLEHEKELFNIVIKKLSENKEKFTDVLNGNKEKKKENLLIRFKGSVSPFLDEKGSRLGPFKKGDVANLPRKIASILIQSKKAAKIIVE